MKQNEECKPERHYEEEEDNKKLEKCFDDVEKHNDIYSEYRHLSDKQDEIYPTKKY